MAVEATAADVVHYDVRGAISIKGIEHFDDARVLHAGEVFGFAAELLTVLVEEAVAGAAAACDGVAAAGVNFLHEELLDSDIDVNSSQSTGYLGLC